MSRKTIVIAGEDLNAIRENLKKSKKIPAIKILRIAYHAKYKESLGLREAKAAVEFEQYTMGLPGAYPPVPHACKLAGNLRINKVEVETAAGPVSIDLEELEFRILSDINTIGVMETGRMLEIVSVFQAWNEGKRVGVIEDQPE